MSKHESLREAQLAVMEDVGYVQKLGKVGTGKFGYTYAGEKELIAQLRPSMVTHGVVMYPVKSDVYETESYTTEKGSRVSIVLAQEFFALSMCTPETILTSKFLRKQVIEEISGHPRP